MTIIYYVVVYLILMACVMRLFFGSRMVTEFWVLLGLALIMSLATL